MTGFLHKNSKLQTLTLDPFFASQCFFLDALERSTFVGGCAKQEPVMYTTCILPNPYRLLAMRCAWVIALWVGCIIQKPSAWYFQNSGGLTLVTGDCAVSNVSRQVEASVWTKAELRTRRLELFLENLNSRFSGRRMVWCGTPGDTHQTRSIKSFPRKLTNGRVVPEGVGPTIVAKNNMGMQVLDS